MDDALPNYNLWFKAIIRAPSLKKRMVDLCYAHFSLIMYFGLFAYLDLFIYNMSGRYAAKYVFIFSLSLPVSSYGIVMWVVYNYSYYIKL